MLPTKLPITNPERVHFGQLLYRVVIKKLDKKEHSKLEFPRLFPVVEIISVETIRPSENRSGIIVEGVHVNKLGEMIPSSPVIKDITIPFDMSNSRLGENVWSDDGEFCQAFAYEKARELQAELEIRKAEIEEHGNLLTQIINMGA